jgi:hypothetical protein
MEPATSGDGPRKDKTMIAGLMMKYFVLKPKGDHVYAKASRMAMTKYADVVSKENPELAAELREWSNQENAESYARSLASAPNADDRTGT